MDVKAHVGATQLLTSLTGGGLPGLLKVGTIDDGAVMDGRP
jgi:hypothetical protein